MSKTIKLKQLHQDDLGNLFAQLAMLLKEGVAIDDALDILRHGWERPAMRTLVAELCDGVRADKRLSSVLSRQPLLFPPFLTEHIERAEKAGKLGGALARAADYLQATATLDMDRSGDLRNTFFYPLAVLTVMLLISVVLMIFVIPQFEAVFANFGAQLPALTRMVIGLSHGIERYWMLLLGVLAVLVFVWRLGIRRLTPIQYLAIRLLSLLPGYSTIYLQSRAARLLHTWGFMLEDGQSLPQAVAASAQLPLGPYYQLMLQRLADKARGGAPLAQLLEAEKVIPKRMVQAVAVGARLSAPQGLYRSLAESYAVQLQKRIKFIASQQEVFLITLLALVIGTMVIAMYLPIFKLGEVV